VAPPGQPIIVIKRSSGHAGHHGGAWKVAYADFVTAMMALFIVLWLMNTSKPIQEAISGYFKDPAGNGKLTGSNQAGPKETAGVSKENMANLKQALEKAIQQVADFDKLKSHIEITVTPEGLRIELMESQKDTFFDSGRPDPNGSGRELLMTIAEELGKLPNKLSIEGHTDSQPYSGDANYTNWELSSDRANASRRLMQLHGLRSDQVAQVRGFADQQPRTGKERNDPSNRRISVIVQYLEKPGATNGAANNANSLTGSGGGEKSAPVQNEKKP
jgi:chemotaxis protein MotB